MIDLIVLTTVLSNLKKLILGYCCVAVSFDINDFHLGWNHPKCLTKIGGRQYDVLGWNIYK